MANEALLYVDMIGGVALAGTAVGISLGELYKGAGGKLPAAPMSVVLTLLLFAAAGMLMTSIICAVGMYTSTAKDDLVKQAMSYHRRLAGVLVLITGIYAGLELNGKAAKCGESEEEACDALFSGTLSYGEGLFLGALVYKGLDSVMDAVVTFFYYDEDEDERGTTKDELVADRRMNDLAGLAALALSLVLFMVYRGEDDVFDKYKMDADGKWQPIFNQTTITDEGGKNQQELIQISMIFSIIVLGVVALLTAFSNSNKILATVGTLSSSLTHAVAGLLSVQVGQFFHVQAYATGDTSFLPSNFFYLGAVLLALFAARHFDSKDRTDEDREESDKVRLAVGAFVISFGVGLTALFGIRDLYHKIQYVGDITKFTKVYENVTVGTKNVTVGNVTTVEDVVEQQLVEAEGPIASEARELGMYVLVIVAYIGLHTIGVKITELLIKSGCKPIGICKNTKVDEDDKYTTQRSNLSLMFALTTAVLFGSRVAQGPGVSAIADSAIASIWITFLLAALGRGISFLGVIAADELDSLFWNSKAVRIFTDLRDYAPVSGNTATGRKVDIPCLNAVISLVLSAVFFTVHITNKQHFFGSDVGTEESTWDGVFLFIAWLGVLAHVVLTFFGIFLPKLGGKTAFHAGTIPFSGLPCRRGSSCRLEFRSVRE